MLKATKEKLDALYAGGKHRGMDGQLYEIDPKTSVSPEQGEALAALHRSLRPLLSIEVGMAYGYSTLYLLDAIYEGRYGQHIAIDPFQISMWHGIGLRCVRDAGFGGKFGRFRWLQERSALALSRMQQKQVRAQFIYIDGSHLFDDAIIDFSLSDKIMDIGGVIVLDDLWMPAIQRTCDFIDKNMRCYEHIDIGWKNLAAFKKATWDDRPWDHYVGF